MVKGKQIPGHTFVVYFRELPKMIVVIAMQKRDRAEEFLGSLSG